MPGFGVMVHYLPDKQIDQRDQALRRRGLRDHAGRHARVAPDPDAGAEQRPVHRAQLRARGALPGQRREPPAARPALEIGQALRSRGIALILYLPFRAPQSDRALMGCLGDVSEQQPPPRASSRPGRA
jgi:hypothetical protein